MTRSADIATLTAAAADARAALQAATDARDAAEAEAAAARQARSVEWAFDTILRYPGRQAEAGAKVDEALKTFASVVVSDLGSAPRAYIGIAEAMSRANALGHDLWVARSILRERSILPPAQPGNPDPIGESAPYPTWGTSVALPAFADLVGSTLAAAREAAFRVRPTHEDPGAFTDVVSNDMKRSVLASEYRDDQELALLAAYRIKDPAHWERLDPARQAAAAAWLACREAAGHGDEPLPKIAPAHLHSLGEPLFAPDDTVRIRLFDGQHRPTRR